MKSFFILTMLVLCFTPKVESQLYVEGRYQNKNLFVQNPENGDDNGWCVTKITVNEIPVNKDFTSSVFEIDLAELDLEKGAALEIVIEHKEDCSPKIMNPEDILPKSTFEITKMTVDEDGLFEWTTKGEKGALLYQVQLYRWNKWVDEGRVMGTGKEGPNNYEFNLQPHSGENKVRVLQMDYSGNKRKSPEKVFDSKIEKVELVPSKEKAEIKFVSENNSIATKYELYDTYGNIIKKGYSDKIDCESLPKGDYNINFDNTNAHLMIGDFVSIVNNKKEKNE